MDLKVLILGSCSRIVGRLEDLQDMNNLKKLDLSGVTKITGDLKCLKDRYLTVLNLHNCQHVTGELSLFKSMDYLEVMDFHGCGEIRGTLKDIKNHRNTRVLDLGECHNIKGSLHDISPHHHLTTLDLSLCNIDGDLATLSSLAKLEILRLVGCFKIEGDLADLIQMTLIYEIDISDVSEMEGHLGSLLGLKDLEEANISRCRKITGHNEDLAPLEKLGTLRLTGCSGIDGYQVHNQEMSVEEKGQRAHDRRMKGRKKKRGSRGGSNGGASSGAGGAMAIGGGNVWTPTSDESGHIYYTNQMTGETSWGDSDLNMWEPVMDPAGTYYRNVVTGNTSWVNPADDSASVGSYDAYDAASYEDIDTIGSFGAADDASVGSMTTLQIEGADETKEEQPAENPRPKKIVYKAQMGWF
mmetsp:Transcript_99290/g.284062  ORF Transcript_99290/g.284062 Transcript_99290/m.284062 type:complete len:412 (+) Transcript_99290:90-1325(+)